MCTSRRTADLKQKIFKYKLTLLHIQGQWYLNNTGKCKLRQFLEIKIIIDKVTLQLLRTINKEIKYRSITDSHNIRKWDYVSWNGNVRMINGWKFIHRCILQNINYHSERINKYNYLLWNECSFLFYNFFYKFTVISWL